MKTKLAQLTTKLIGTLFFSAISLCSLAGETYEENKAFDLKDVKSLTLKIDHAEIELVRGEENELKITLSQDLKKGDADVCLHNIHHTSKADSLEVYTQAKKRSNFSNCNIKRTVHIQLDQETIQKLNVQHNHGALTADSFTPKMLFLNISHSKITLGKIDSTTAKLQFDHTDLNVETIAAEKLEIKGAHGATHINEVTSDQLLLERSHGNIEINLSKVDQFTGRQSHGNLLLKTHQGTDLNLQNSHGRITVSEGQAETVKLTNSHSSINYSGSSDTIDFSNQHGSTNLAQHNADFKSIEGSAAHGSVELTLPKNSLCELEGATLKKVSADMFKKDGACDEVKSNGLVKLHTSHGKARISLL